MDRVSNLPDEVLCHILSFLRTKEAALTSILAKRWRNLLAFVPSLTIYDSVFLHPEIRKQYRPDIVQSFKDFVDRVLVLQGNAPLKKFSLESFSVADTDRLDGWITNVLARGVSDLDLNIILSCDEEDNYQLSPKCFKCSTLVSLRISCGFVDIAPGHISLPLLKTMVLDSAHLCPNAFETLLPALPSLEELLLDNVRLNDMDIRLSNASVKTLTMNFGECSSFNTSSFDTPSLLHFHYDGSVAYDYPVVNMENLVDAKIEFFVIEDSDALQYSNAWKLFHGIRNVTNLDLFPDTLHVLSVWSESVPVLKNLKSLAVTTDEYRGWPAIPALLRNCPHLETLVIEGLVHHVTDKCGDVCDCISREDKGFSLTLCPVKVVKIHGFKGTMKEVAMVEHFLEYFPSLEEMVVVFCEENNNPTQLLNHEVPKLVSKIFQLYRKYSSCNVKFMHQGEIICV